MKYSIQALLDDSKNGIRHKYIFFWGHQKSQDGIITKNCFSQWWESLFVVNEIEYKTAEHWMMIKKAELFGDDEIRKKILHSTSPAEAKSLGRAVRNYNEDVWNIHKYEIVKTGNYHKFQQNHKLKEFLLQTNNRILVEASPVDAIWGIGLPMDHKNIDQPEAWRGLNLLGFALMEVRELLK